MSNRLDLAPLFTDIQLSADDANAIVAALEDVAETDGQHAEEMAMIQAFVEMLDADLGEKKPTKLAKMSPEKLALAIPDESTRKVAIQSAILLAWADGTFTDKERARVVEYATALGFSRAAYDGLEKVITGWVKSGDMKPLF